MIKQTEDQMEAEIEKMASRLRADYGELLTLKEAANILRYTTSGALRKAHSRGTSPIRLFRIPNRKGWFASADELARALKQFEYQRNEND